MIHPCPSIPDPSPVLPYAVACAAVRRSLQSEADRCRANGNPDAAREIEGAIGNALVALQNEMHERGVMV